MNKFRINLSQLEKQVKKIEAINVRKRLESYLESDRIKVLITRYFVDINSYTLGFERKIRSKLSESTSISYEYALGIYEKNGFGKKRLRTYNGSIVRRMYKGLEDKFDRYI